jgi:hypothetical protein
MSRGAPARNSAVKPLSADVAAWWCARLLAGSLMVMLLVALGLFVEGGPHRVEYPALPLWLTVSESAGLSLTVAMATTALPVLGATLYLLGPCSLRYTLGLLAVLVVFQQAALLPLALIHLAATALALSTARIGCDAHGVSLWMMMLLFVVDTGRLFPGIYG